MQGKEKKERPEGKGVAVGEQRLQLLAAEERGEEVQEREEEEMHYKTEVQRAGKVRG